MFRSDPNPTSFQKPKPDPQPCRKETPRERKHIILLASFFPMGQDLKMAPRANSLQPGKYFKHLSIKQRTLSMSNKCRNFEMSI